MKSEYSEKFLISAPFDIKKLNTGYSGSLTKEEAKKKIKKGRKRLRKLQEKLYADRSQSLLIILQGMDAAGKDSLIKHVLSRVDAQGCVVHSFKTPSPKEYTHDFLWRHYTALPEKGKIGIFNRSHYESVLVCRVHPEYNLNEMTWNSLEDFDENFWKNRYESILDFEKHLSRNGTKIIKFFLNISKEAQKNRFIERIDDPKKNWKFSAGDMQERDLWEKYQEAYQKAIMETSTPEAPWYILPSDEKWYSRLVACEIIIDTLEDMNLAFPKAKKKEKAKMQEYKSILEKEK